MFINRFVILRENRKTKTELAKTLSYRLVEYLLSLIIFVCISDLSRKSYVFKNNIFTADLFRSYHLIVVSVSSTRLFPSPSFLGGERFWHEFYLIQHSARIAVNTGIGPLHYWILSS